MSNSDDLLSLLQLNKFLQMVGHALHRIRGDLFRLVRVSISQEIWSDDSIAFLLKWSDHKSPIKAGTRKSV
jgi:hypothetical protein